MLSSPSRRQGQRGCCPFPLHPNPRPTCLRFAPDGTILLDDSEHLFHNHQTSVASLRLLFTFLPNAVRLPSGINVQLHRNTHFTSWNLSAALSRPAISSKPLTANWQSCGATAVAASIPRTSGSSNSAWPSLPRKRDDGAAPNRSVGGVLQQLNAMFGTRFEAAP